MTPAFTATMLRTLLIDRRVMFGDGGHEVWTVPAVPELTELARLLSGWADYANDGRAATEMREAARRKAAKAMRAAIAALALLRAVAPDCAELGSALAVMAALQNSPALASPAWRPMPWRTFALALAGDFHTAMVPENPHIRLGAVGGPLPRFVAAVVPYLTGERPKVSSVAVRLKIVRVECRKRGLWLDKESQAGD